MNKLVSLLPLVGLVGCASLSSYQEAKVLPTGEGQLSIGVTGYTDDLNRSILGDTSTGHDFKLLELGGRVGVWNNLDLGFKYTLIGAATLDAKYQLLGRDSGSAFQLSSGFKGGYANLEVTIDSETVEVPVYDLIIPLYATYSPASWMSITLAPEFCYRISDNEFEYPAGPIAGGNVDLRLGKSSGLIAEFGYHKHLDKDYSLINYGAMVYMPFKLEGVLGFAGL